jgi:proteasome assembly chaperone (PAC2) family protein
VGASGLLLGLGKIHGIDGLCLMGETIGMPMVTDPKAADKVLHILVKILGVKVDMAKLEKTISEMEEKIEKTDKIHKEMLEKMKRPHDESSRYIG